MDYFKPEEFACKCGCGCGSVSPRLIKRLNAAREEAGVPFVITSGCRCAAHNKKVGGAPQSSHLNGTAADIAVTDTNRDVILAAARKHFSRIGIAQSFIHVDVDSKPAAEWRYS